MNKTPANKKVLVTGAGYIGSILTGAVSGQFGRFR